MKLHEVPRNTKIRIVDDVGQHPPAHREFKPQEVLHFYHTDGMYSFCTDSEGKPVHLVAWQEVEVIDE
jgi:hypothetical protein